MNQHDPQKVTRDAWQRRFTYGTNVAAMIVGVLVILVAVNWIAVRLVGRHGAALRFDLTATRQYSLSQQTRNILTDLQTPLEIATVFADTGSLDPDTARKIADFRDLLNEYAKRSGGKVSARHIDVTRIDQFNTFAATLADRYTDQITPAIEAAGESVAVMGKLAEAAKVQSQRFLRAAEVLGSNNPSLRRQLSEIGNFLQVRSDQLAKGAANADFADALSQAMPQIRTVVEATRPAIKAFVDDSIGALIDYAQKEAEADDVPVDVGGFFRESLKAFRAMKQDADRAVERLESLELDEYNAVRNKVYGGDTALVMTDDDLVAVSLDDVYTITYDPEADNPAPDTRFRGEEAVTGAITSLTFDQAPLVVFVSSDGQPVTGPRGAYSHVAERLRNMNFQVLEWNPAGKPSPFGGPPAPMPKPVPDEGQAVAWIVLPGAPVNPMNPAAGGGIQQMQALSGIVADGDPVLVILARSMMGRFGQPDPIADSVGDLGFNVETGKWILTEVIGQDGQAYPSNQISAFRWDDDHPVGEALEGQAVTAVAAMPVQLAAADGRSWALLSTPADVWAEEAWMDQQTMPRRGADEATGPFAIAAAHQSDGGRRSVVIADETLATDSAIMSEQIVLTDAGPEVIRFVRNSGNAELFVNSVYWLTGMEQLIATGARTQDVRRFGPVGDSVGNLTRWLLVLGLPLACLAAGAAVWMFRRN